jgi:hypothetical protein
MFLLPLWVINSEILMPCSLWVEFILINPLCCVRLFLSSTSSLYINYKVRFIFINFTEVVCLTLNFYTWDVFSSGAVKFLGYCSTCVTIAISV